MTREKRYLAGLFTILALLYFYIDLENEWVSSFLFYGWTEDDGSVSEGIFGISSIVYFKNLNLIAAGLGLGYIIDCILVSKYGEKFNDNRITIPQVVSYLTPILLILFWLFVVDGFNQ